MRIYKIGIRVVCIMYNFAQNNFSIMKFLKILGFTVLFSVSLNAQVQVKDTIRMGYVLPENDSLIAAPVLLEEVVIIAFEFFVIVCSVFKK